MTIDSIIDASSGLAGDAGLVRRLVDEVMARVPSTTDRVALEEVGHLAAAELRTRPGGGGVDDTDVAVAVKAAIADRLRSWFSGPPTGSADDEQEHARRAARRASAAAMVASLPLLERRVVAGFFVEDRAVDDIAAETDRPLAEVVDLRAHALRRLREAHHPLV